MFRKKANFCPFLKKECIGKECALHVTILGKDPQTNKDIEESQCAIAWMPIVQIETSKEVRSVSASVDNLRTENENRQRWWVSVLDKIGVKRYLP